MPLTSIPCRASASRTAVGEWTPRLQRLRRVEASSLRRRGALDVGDHPDAAGELRRRCTEDVADGIREGGIVVRPFQLDQHRVGGLPWSGQPRAGVPEKVGQHVGLDVDDGVGDALGGPPGGTRLPKAAAVEGDPKVPARA